MRIPRSYSVTFVSFPPLSNARRGDAISSGKYIAQHKDLLNINWGKLSLGHIDDISNLSISQTIFRIRYMYTYYFFKT